MRQAGVHGPGLIRGIEHFVKRIIQRDRQTLPAKFRVAGQRRPARLDILPIRLFETFGCCDAMVGGIKMTALAVTRMIQGKQHLRGEFSTLFKHLINRVPIKLRMRR